MVRQLETGSNFNGKVDGTGDVEKIKTRALIIHGEEDKTVPIDHAQQMSEAIKGCKFEHLPNVDHFTWLDNLDLTVSLMSKFLNQ